MAAVFCDSFSLVAIVLRNLLILTRSSRAGVEFGSECLLATAYMASALVILGQMILPHLHFQAPPSVPHTLLWPPVKVG